MSIYEVGRDVDVKCTRCKLELSHTILAMVNGIPARVQCNTCHSQRKYRAPKGSGTTATRRRTPRGTTAKTSASKTASDYAKTAEWNARISKVDAEGTEARAYTMREAYESGELLVHRKFGRGFVTGLLDDRKIRVCFQDGERVLVHAR